MKNLGLYEQENTLLNSLMAIKQKAQAPSGNGAQKPKQIYRMKSHSMICLCLWAQRRTAILSFACSNTSRRALNLF